MAMLLKTEVCFVTTESKSTLKKQSALVEIHVVIKMVKVCRVSAQ